MALSTRALSRAAIVAALAISACSTDTNNTAAFAVTGSSPTEGQTIAANAPVGVSFNRVPKSAAATFAPDVGTINITISGSAASFAPASGSFAAGTSYTLTVTATDANNNGLATPFVLNFKTAAPDTTAPAAVTDLAVVASSITDTGLTLTWTATGDDGTAGTATSYEVRYLSGAACPITVANFGATGTGTPVPAGAPKPAGSTETLAVTGLTAATPYCFALRVFDEAANPSGLSNVANATTAAGPDTTAPGKPVLTAPPATITATSIGLSWIAVGDDGSVGTVSDREIKFKSGAACAAFTSANFATGTALDLGAPAPGGTQETAIATGLTSKTTYCFIEKVADAAGNTNFSDVLTVTTLDGIAPAIPVVTGVGGNTSVALHFTAVGDDGNVGTAANYHLAFVGPITTCPATAADFVGPRTLDTTTTIQGQVVHQLPAPQVAGTAETLLILALQQNSHYCFALSVQDAAGNDSGFSTVVPVTTTGTVQPAPSAITDLRAVIDGDSLGAGDALTQTVSLSWTAPDTSDGQAAARYSIRFATFTGAACPLTAANVGAASEVANAPTPQSPGGEESFDVVVPITSDATGVCFAVLSQSLSSAVSAISDLAKPPHKIDDLAGAAITDTSANLTFTAPLFQTGTTAGEYTVAYLPQGDACPAFGSDIPGLDGAVVFDGGPATGNTIPVTGLTASTSYCVAIFANDTDNDASWSNVASITTTAAPKITPPAPGNLIFVSATTSAIDIQFDASADNAADNSGVSSLYTILFAAQSDCSTFDPATASSLPLDETGLVTAAGQHIDTEISRLAAGTQYCIAVTATNAEGNTSAISTVLTASTQQGEGGGGTPPTAIVDLRATILGNIGSESEDLTSVTALTWSAPANSAGGAVSSYQILAGTNGSCPITADNVASQTVLGDPPTPAAPGTKETYSAFAPITLNGDSVCFAIISKDAAGNASALSNVPLPPIGVTNLNQGDATNDTSADLSFSTPVFQDGTTAAPFKYALAPALADGNCPQFGSDIAGLPGGTLVDIAQLQNGHQLPITGLTPNSNYCVALLSADTDGDAAWSNVAPINTSDQSAPPQPPNLSVTGTTTTTLSIQFDSVVDNDRAQTGVALKYNVVYEALADCSNFQEGNATTLVLDETGIITAPGQHITATITGLAPATQYCLFVQAVNAGGQVGNGSEIVSGTTQTAGGGGGATPPAAITDLTTRLEGDSLAPGAEGQNQQTAYLKWTAPGDANGQRVASYTIYTATDEGCPITTANLANAIKLPQTFQPAGPGGTEGVELQVTAVDTDDVCFVVTSTDSAGNTSNLSNDSLPPHVSDDLTATAGEPKESTENLSFSTFFQIGTTQKDAIAFAVQATGACPLNSSDFFNQDTNIIVDASGGSALFTGLSSATDYCVGVRLTNNQDDISFSLAAGFTTGTPPPPPDETPPGPVVIQALQPLDATSTGATLHWTAPADNGTDASSGKVASYSVYYVTVAQGSTDDTCAGIDAITAGTLVPVQPAPVADPGTLETAVIALAGSDKMPVCIAATATDAAGNTSARQAFRLITDTTAPAQVTLTTQSPTFSSIDLAFIDSGDDNNTGTAASYKLAFVKGACPGTFDFTNATLVTGLPAPQAAGTSEVITVPGLDYSTTYCFGLAIVDAAGNASPTATAQGTTAAPDVTGDLTKLRADVAAGTTPLNDTVHAALVTYVKAAVGTAALGTPDGAGFFIQPSDSPAVTVPTAVPAIFVGIDTSGLAVGDVIDLTATSAALLGCKTPPCTSLNGLEVVTAASVAVRSHGHALPFVPDFSNLTTADYPAPITVSNWPFESNLIDITGVITSPLAANGFTSYFFNTAGVTETRDSAFEFRIPTTLVTSLGLVTGQTIRVKDTPLFRQEVTVAGASVEQVSPSAWAAADVIAGPTVSFNPASGTITTTPTISVVYSEAMDTTTVTGQAADGSCAGSVQFSKDNFTTCLALTLTPDSTNKIFTLGLAKLADGTSYQLKTTSDAKDATNHLGAVSATTNYSTPAVGGLCTSVSPVVISQVYGGGGGGTSSVLRDFVELHNRGETDINIGGWSVQYASATGTTYQVTTIPTGATSVVPAGGYFLVNESTGTVGTVFAGDVTGTIAMAAGAGRVVLVNGTAAINTGTPAPALCATQGTIVTLPAGASETVIDSVSYGSTTSCTTTAAAATGTQPSATASVARSLNGCTDTAKPSADFAIVSGAAIAPRSTAKLGTTAQFCSCDGSTKVNGLGAAGGEIDSCNIDAPTSITGTHGTSVGPSNGTFAEATLPNGAVVKGQVGYGIAGTDPFTQFVFTAGTAAANGTDYSASFTAPAAGSYSFLWRFSLDSGSHWTYCDIKGAGATAANPFDATNLGTLVSQ